MIKKILYVIISLVLTKERWVLFLVAVLVICILITIILFLVLLAVAQIKMAGMEVKRLIRVREGSLKLGDLPKGKWRYLTAEEIDTLRK